MSDNSGSGFGVVPTYLRGQLTMTEIAVYVALTWRADEYGECYPSHQTIAKDAGCSVPTVKRALQSMRDKGIVTWHQRATDEHGQMSNVYKINIWREPPEFENQGVDHTDLPPRSHRATPSVCVSYELQPDELQPENKEDTPPLTVDQVLLVEVENPKTIDPFDEFWDAYPYKKGKQAARKAWESALSRISPGSPRYGALVIINGVKRLRDDPNLPEKQFIPHPSTWLNQHRWEDEPYPPRRLTPAEEKTRQDTAMDAWAKAQDERQAAGLPVQSMDEWLESRR